MLTTETVYEVLMFGEKTSYKKIASFDPDSAFFDPDSAFFGVMS